MALGPFSVTAQREEDIDFSMATDGAGGHGRIPEALRSSGCSSGSSDGRGSSDSSGGSGDGNPDTVIDQKEHCLLICDFSPRLVQLWALVLASMVAMAGSVVGVVAGEGRIFGEAPKNIVAKTCLCVLSTLMQDGSEWVPPHDAGRVLLTTWLLASMVFMSSYEGILVAMLTFPRVSIPIDSLTELVHQDDLPWRLEYGAMMARMKAGQH
ncbi:uncharacterized protein LOC123508673 [Portunus trituberculatus]|uniref:uncharacterized protein LOC123508673 n=1 Tax=Portunus trituberculatus TaxID=210409 RepID=UPI001E1CE726|nr:uncharacterized protein LOC123508673 [Portunus trituberculatus]